MPEGLYLDAFVNLLSAADGSGSAQAYAEILLKRRGIISMSILPARDRVTCCGRREVFCRGLGVILYGVVGFVPCLLGVWVEAARFVVSHIFIDAEGKISELLVFYCIKTCFASAIIIEGPPARRAYITFK